MSVQVAAVDKYTAVGPGGRASDKKAGVGARGGCRGRPEWRLPLGTEGFRNAGSGGMKASGKRGIVVLHINAAHSGSAYGSTSLLQLRLHEINHLAGGSTLGIFAWYRTACLFAPKEYFVDKLITLNEHHTRIPAL